MDGNLFFTFLYKKEMKKINELDNNKVPEK
jgi:hypothetical protein